MAKAATKHATAAAALESKLELQRIEFRGEQTQFQQEWHTQREQMAASITSAGLKNETDLQAAHAAGERAIEEIKAAHALTVSQSTLAWEERVARREKELAEATLANARKLGEQAEVRIIDRDDPI